MSAKRGALKKIGFAGVTVLMLAAMGIAAQAQNYFSDWPAGTDPAEIGKKLATNYVARKFEFETMPGKRQYVIYPEVCAWYGSLTVAQLTHDNDLTTRLVNKFTALTNTMASRISPEAHVDFRVFGVVPLEIYLQTRDKNCLEFGRSFADRQWEKTTPDGITSEARYWIDDMYMITAVEVQAYRATKDKKYLDRAALTMSAYLDKLQQPNGLFYHAPDSPFFWSRGNGWVAAGMTELLRSLPQDHPQHARILKGYQTMMASLLRYQGEDGLWRELIDHTEAWPETSGTGMFTFAMVTGVKNGWLESGLYGPAARKAWLGLVKFLEPDGNVRNVCEGTNKGNSVDYYLARQRLTGDLHGQAAVLWSATALLR
jgi:unsaturated rhamnogalacturonyl hydrolase